jgi:hypothetical protein
MAPGEIRRKRNEKKKGHGVQRGKGQNDEKIVIKKGKGKNVAKNAPPGQGKKQKQQLRTNPTKAQKGKKGGKPVREKKTPLTEEELEKQMDEYWLKSKDKTVAAKKLDEDMDSYWAKKGEEEGKEGEAAAEETKADDDKKEEATAEAS